MRHLRATVAVLVVSCSAASAQVVRQATDLEATLTTAAAVDDAGTTAFSISDADPFGTNPGHVLQVFRWNLATGTGTQVTDFPGGVQAGDDPYGPSVTDDGERIAFVEGDRLALVHADGTGLVRLTTAPATIFHFQIAGNGSRVVFDSPSDLTGANPGGIVQVFVVESDGTNLRQLTSHAGHAYGIAWPSISDDGQRIAYLASEGSVDGGAQLAGILQDGTGFHWITSYTNLQPGWKQISGNGRSVAFQSCSSSLPPPTGGCWSGCQIVLVEWDGTGLTSLDAPCDGNAAPGWAGAPDITDDAQTVFYPARNFGVYDYWRIDRDRSGHAAVTDVLSEPGPLATCSGFARVAGSGSRVTFDCFGGEPWGGPNPDLSKELYAAAADGTGHLQISDTLAGDSFDPDITPGGGRMVFAASANPLHEPGIVGTQIYRMAPNGADLARITSLSYGSVSEPTVSDDGTWIAFTHDGRTVYSVRDDGTMLTDLLAGLYPGNTGEPHMASDSSVVVFTSEGDLLQEGLGLGKRVYRVNRDGSGLTRVSAASNDWSEHPRIDATRAWVVYARAGNIRRTRIDGTVDQQITILGMSDRPDATPGAGLVVYQSTGDPLGTNGDGNTEIFLWGNATSTVRQLTATTQGHNVSPRISRDGAWATFWSDTEGEFEPYRVEIGTGRIERIGGLRGCASAFAPFYPGGPEPAPVALDRNGSVAVHGWPGDCAGSNRDRSPELFVIDWLAVPRLFPGAGPAPTVVTWDVDPRYRFYDLVRGDAASLALRGDGTVDLGQVVCVENDSADASTAGSPDPDTPAPGQAFFYLHRGTEGPEAGPGSYGRGSGGGERTPSGGGCEAGDGADAAAPML